MKNLLNIFCGLCCVCILVACSGKTIAPSPKTYTVYADTPTQDLQTIPQDLNYFAKKTQANTRLLTSAEQAQQDARFNRIFFGAWQMSRSSIAKTEVKGLFGKARGYKMNAQKWTNAEWNALLKNADLNSYPNCNRRGITTTHANLRNIPTSEMRFDKPTFEIRKNPFDYQQASSIAHGTPLIVAHISRDKRWYFVETPVVSAWVRAEDVGWVDQDVISRYRTNKYIALIKDNVSLQSAGQSVGREHIGALFPLARQIGNNFVALVPVRNNTGNAVLTEVPLTHEQAVRKPMPLTANNLARVGNIMMGQPYCWAGILEGRDCSATMHDLFTPFGLWLPRNSAQQSRSGLRTFVDDLENDGKKTSLKQQGIPFLTLVWLPGHIALYVGDYRNQPVIFHNMWGVSVTKNGDSNARHVVGQCLISTLEPGKELDNLNKNTLIIDRTKAFTILGRD